MVRLLLLAATQLLGASSGRDAQSPQPTETVATITIYRSGGGKKFIGVPCDHPRHTILVLANDVRWVRVTKGHFATLLIPPGSYILKTVHSKPVDVALEPGLSYFVRPRQTCGGFPAAHEELEFVPKTLAESELQNLDPITAKDIYLNKNHVKTGRYYSSK
jgi:hypothetical protein